jgi:D-glycero-D-manno-heptose 1,7-bisphosphate phosphatase
VLIPGAAELLVYANRLLVPVVEINNQAGIARGYYGWEEFFEVENALRGRLATSGASIDAVYACPYHRDGIERWAHPAHPARKPRPGMLHAAAQTMNLDLKSSWIVGDKHGDLLAGQAAGLRGGLHVLTGHGAAHRPRIIQWRPEQFELRTGDSIRDAFAIVDLLRISGPEP